MTAGSRFPMGPQVTRRMATDRRWTPVSDGARDRVTARVGVDVDADGDVGPPLVEDRDDVGDHRRGEGGGAGGGGGGDRGDSGEGDAGESRGWLGATLGGGAALGLLMAGAAGGGSASRAAASGGEADTVRPSVPAPAPGPNPDPGRPDPGVVGTDSPTDSPTDPGAEAGVDTTPPSAIVPGSVSPDEPQSEPPTDRTPRVALLTGVQTPAGGLATRDATVVVSGVAADASWWYSLDQGRTWSRGRGDRIPSEAFGEDGLKQLLVRQVDAAGMPGAQAGLSFTLDKSAPALPRPRLLNDTGVAGDQLTYDWSFSVGTLETGATWRYRVDGAAWQDGAGDRLVVPGGNGLAGPLADGAHTVQVEVRDLVGNRSEGSLDFTLDTVGPTTVLMSRLEHDSGSFDSDRITANPALALDDLEPEDRWSASVDQGASWMSLLPGESPSNFFGHLMGTDGDWEVLVRREDLAGNAGPAGPAIAFTLDRQGPATPATVRLLNDTGPDKTDGITSDATLQVTMNGDAVRVGYRLRAGDPLTTLGGDLRIPDARFAASNTPYTVEVIQSDLAGNLGVSTFFTFTKPVALEAPSLALPGAAFMLHGVGLPI